MDKKQSDKELENVCIYIFLLCDFLFHKHFQG